MSKNAIISVSDKRGIESFAKGLHTAGYEIHATGETFEFLRSYSIPAVKIETVAQITVTHQNQNVLKQLTHAPIIG